MEAGFRGAGAGLLAAAILTMTVTPVLWAQSGDLLKELTVRWMGMKNRLLDIAEVMPAEKYTFKPTAEVRSFGEQLEHLAETNYERMSEMSGKKAPEMGAHGHGSKSKAEIVKILSDSFDWGSQTLEGLTPSQALETVPTRFLGQATRQNVVVQAMMNAMDHYGQLVVYLRLNGIVPPRTAAAAVIP